jgi:hypothetical protein
MGGRGNGAVGRLNRIEGTEIKAICDVEPAAIRAALDRIGNLPNAIPTPDTYSGHEDEWKKVCERDDIDLIIVTTPWDLHAPQCIYSMEHGKHVATEIPAAQTIEECWQLVETSERTRKHCLQMTNVCYGDFEMTTLNMARQGFLGDIIHGDGAYIHQLMRHNFSREQYHNMWRLRGNYGRNGNLYPHHGLGTMAQIMDINHGDKMEFMVSVSSHDFMMRDRAKELAGTDPFFEDFTENKFRGNMNVSIIKTHRGRTMMLEHDVTSPRPYSRIHQICGTKAIARTFPSQQIADSYGGWFSDEEFEATVEQYRPEISEQVGRMAREVGGHGGMDAMLMWRLIDCLRNGIPLDMNVYDAASWSAVVPLSEWSVANEGVPEDFPDFTSGAWRTNEPQMDIQLEQGASTNFV